MKSLVKIYANTYICIYFKRAEKNGGKAILDNLKPICVSCNSSMRTMDMNDFINKYGFKKNDKCKGIIVNENKDNIVNENKYNIVNENIDSCKNSFDLKKLKLKELRNICDFYDISYNKKNNKSKLIDIISNIKKFDYYNYLRKSLEDFKIMDLKNICEDINLSKNGRKKDLVDKIINSDYVIEITDYIDNDTNSNIKNQNEININNGLFCLNCGHYGHVLYECNYK